MFYISPKQLRIALENLQQAESMGLDRCLVVLELMPDTGRLEYRELVERFLDKHGKLKDYGCNQDIATQSRVVDGELQELSDEEQKALWPMFQARHDRQRAIHERRMAAKDRQERVAQKLGDNGP